MLARHFLIALVVFATTVAAKTQNLDPQYAILTIANKWQLFLLENVIEAGSNPGLMDKLAPVKKQMYQEIDSGKAQEYSLMQQIGEFVTEVDKTNNGFQSAVSSYFSENPVNFYAISKITPEASWDFIYWAAKRAAKELGNAKISKSLEALNEEVEPVFRKPEVDVKALVEKIDDFTLSATAVAPGFSDSIIMAGDIEVEKFRATIKDAANGITPSPTTAATDAGSSAGSAALPAEKDTTAGSSTAGSIESPAVMETEMPENSTTTTPPASLTPTPSATSSASTLSSLITVGASSVAAFAMTYLL